MKEIKEILKSKNFVINEMVIKGINKLDISLSEFMLILYFINIDNSLDMDRIKEYLGMSNEDIINNYSSLTKKGLIETIINKTGKIIEENISLDLFYNKILLSEEKENKKTDVYSKFETEFGRTLSPIEYETINNWLANGISEEMIINALKEAVLNGVSNLRYIDKIIYEWTKKKISNKSNDDEFVKVFDYNWLEDDDEKK